LGLLLGCPVLSLFFFSFFFGDGLMFFPFPSLHIA
jgi:hypothetical protein